MKTTIFLMLVLLFGCSNTVLVKEGVNESEFVRDREICEEKAYVKVGKAPPMSDKIAITSWRRDFDDQFFKCMSEKGYTKQ